MKEKRKMFLGLLFALLFSSCTMLTPHENFKNHMYANIGKKIDSPSTLWVRPDRYIAASELSNGNIENEYWLYGTCHYFFEFISETKIIVGWRFEGSEQDCVIVP